MSSKKVALITGSDGLVGSESVRFFSKLGFEIIGIDNNSRKKFFGDDASVLKNRYKLKKQIPNYSVTIQFKCGIRTRHPYFEIRAGSAHAL